MVVKWVGQKSIGIKDGSTVGGSAVVRQYSRGVIECGGKGRSVEELKIKVE